MIRHDGRDLADWNALPAATRLQLKNQVFKKQIGMHKNSKDHVNCDQ